MLKIVKDYVENHVELLKLDATEKTLKIIGALGYKYMCKLHTKKSLYRNDGGQLRYELYEALLGGGWGRKRDHY